MILSSVSLHRTCLSAQLSLLAILTADILEQINEMFPSWDFGLYLKGENRIIPINICSNDLAVCLKRKVYIHMHVNVHTCSIHMSDES